MKKTLRIIVGLALVLAGLGSCTAGEESREVRWYGWGGSAPINRWLDTEVRDSIKEALGADLVRTAAEAPAILAKLREEKAAGISRGSMDIIWINGENFRVAKEEGLLQGPILDQLENHRRYVDPTLGTHDFGTPVEGLESPWGQAQFVFEYDSARVTEAPRDLDGLRRWILANPGRFTYPELPDFTGSAFVRQLFLQLNGGSEPFQGTFDEDWYQAASARLWAWLDEVGPALWQGGKTYPRSSADLDLLFEGGELDWSMTYTPSRAQGMIIEGRYPSTVRTRVLAEGSLANIHFLAIPFNAPNPDLAIPVVDHFLSPELQLSKLRPENWGDFTVLDMGRLDPPDREAFDALDLGEATLPLAELGAVAMAEISPVYVERLEADWQSYILARR